MEEKQKRKIIIESGESELTNLEPFWTHPNAVIVEDDIFLDKRYLLNIWKCESLGKLAEAEMVYEKEFDEKPSDNQIIYYLKLNEIHNGNFGYAKIEEILIIDYKREVNEEVSMYRKTFNELSDNEMVELEELLDNNN